MNLNGIKITESVLVILNRVKRTLNRAKITLNPVKKFESDQNDPESGQMIQNWAKISTKKKIDLAPKFKLVLSI